MKFFSSKSDVVEINVGGRVFASLRSTFRKEPNSVLCELFESSGSAVQHAKDPFGRIFIDRDGDSFQYVLQYLRLAQTDVQAILIDLTPIQRKKLLVEARFYGLQGLVDMVHPKSLKKDEVIDFNVGGRIFTCPRGMLCNQRASLLGAIAMSPFKTHTFDPSGRAFIKRDGDLFAHVMEYLRHEQQPPEYLANLTPVESERLLAEAKYYKLHGLVRFLTRDTDYDDMRSFTTVEVNVGGKIFAAPLGASRLFAPDSHLAKILFEMRWGSPEWPKDVCGHYYIDRDPLLFEVIAYGLSRLSIWGGGVCIESLVKEYNNETNRAISLNMQSLRDELEYFGVQDAFPKSK